MGSELTHGGEAIARCREAVRAVVGSGLDRPPRRETAMAFAPANVALCKYWGKRDEVLNLPITGSVSVSLGPLGTHTEIRLSDKDRYEINGVPKSPEEPEARRLRAYLDLFRNRGAPGFEVRSRNTVPTAAGVASSASAFASLARALDALWGWGLDVRALSILARLGSGSATRSVAEGFVEWRAGERPDGMDSHALPWPETWPGLCVGLLVIRDAAKEVGSREGMRHTVRTSPLFAAWPETARRDLEVLRAAVRERDFERLGTVAEANALAMHATMIAARPAICYWGPATLEALQRVRELRAAGCPVYATIDAGPNVKLLFTQEVREILQRTFPGLNIVEPFALLQDGPQGDR